MKKTLLLVGSLIVAASTLSPSAPALANACGSATPTLVGTNLPLTFVPFTLSWFQTGCGAVNGEFVSIAPPCPPFVTAFPGEYCGPTKLPGAATLCQINPATPLFLNTYLTVGFDRDFDGNILPTSGEFPVFAQVLPLTGTWSIPHPYGVPARVIAYPTNAVASGPNFADANAVRCI